MYVVYCTCVLYIARAHFVPPLYIVQCIIKLNPVYTSCMLLVHTLYIVQCIIKLNPGYVCCILHVCVVYRTCTLCTPFVHCIMYNKTKSWVCILHVHTLYIVQCIIKLNPGYVFCTCTLCTLYNV